VSEIGRLTARVADFSSKADFWNNGVLLFLVMTALAAAGIVICQRLAFVRAGQTASAQNDLDTAKERDATTERDRVRTELAVAEAKAKEADARIAEAQQSAAEATATAKRFESNIAESNERARAAESVVAAANAASLEATARGKAAEARSAEAERKTLELQSIVLPLDLSQSQRDAIASACKKYAGRTVEIGAMGMDVEARVLAGLIASALKHAGINTVRMPYVVTLGSFGDGVSIGGADADLVNALGRILLDSGDLNVSSVIPTPETAELSAQAAPAPTGIRADARIFVGAYPFTKSQRIVGM
jgi:hypothetical protein